MTEPEGMKITDHLLESARVEAVGALGGGRAMAIRRCLVIHFTAGASALSSIEFWRGQAQRQIDLGAHLTIDRDGTVFQSRRFDRTISHAGKSRWRDPNSGVLHTNCNGFAIGIELANAGSNGKVIEWARKNDAAFAGVVTARHANGGPEQRWERYPEAQVAALIAVSRALVAAYKLDDITGHDCIAPERKDDPGPAFPMLALREACGFEGMPVVHRA